MDRVSRNRMPFRPAALIAILFASFSAQSQNVTNPHASILDVTARQAFLASATNPLLRETIGKLPSCVASPLVPAPTGRIDIPHHYLSGSHGPTNPAEAAATRVYSAFERRITAGMNQYVATGNHAESACALAQLDAWAQAKTLLDYDPQESSQAWYQVEWTLSSAGTTDSVLVNDTTLDPTQQRRVTAWLDAAAHKLISFEKPGADGNNHHYWRALAATSIGVTASDNDLFRFGIDTFKQAIEQLDANGAFPLEMARHERATHYQAFALQPLIVIAEFAARQSLDLYAYQSHGRTLRNAILFFGRAVDDPSLIKPYTTDAQLEDFGPSDFAPFEIYVARFGTTGLPPSIVNALQHPTEATRIGGSATVIAGN
jgi:poly(beta-D-mannuronate) lyase